MDLSSGGFRSSLKLAQDLGGDYYEMAIDDLQTLEVILMSLSREWMQKYNDDQMEQLGLNKFDLEKQLRFRKEL